MPVLKVLITGAAGQIAYSLIPVLCSGNVFGDDYKIDLVLLDLPFAQETLKGVVMEIEDCVFRHLNSVMATTNKEEAFTDIDVAILVGAFPRKEGMTRSDLLNTNVGIFSEQGVLLDKFAKKTVKVIVVGNPANTNCYVAMKNAPSIPKENFTCLTRLDHNRLIGQICLKTKVTPEDVKNVIIWGNHSGTQFPDNSHVKVSSSENTIPLKQLIQDEDWFSEVVKTVATRGEAVIKARKQSSAMSAAKAVGDHLKSWFLGTEDNDWTSMGVVCKGLYGLEEELVYSMPVVCKNGTYSIITNLSSSEESKEKMLKTYKELVSEKEIAMKK